MDNQVLKRNRTRRRRQLRVKKKTRGFLSKYRLCVTRTNKHLYIQLIDDEKHHTIAAIGTMSKDLKKTKFCKKSKEAAVELGKRIAAIAKEKKIQRIVFDRGRYKYHGLLAIAANAIREEGLQF